MILSCLIGALFGVWWFLLRKHKSIGMNFPHPFFTLDEETLTEQEYLKLREEYIKRQREKKMNPNVDIFTDSTPNGASTRPGSSSTRDTI